MKKIIMFIFLSISLFAWDLSDFRNIFDNSIGLCYKPKQYTFDLCGSFPKISDIGVDVCSALPNINGFEKKQQRLNIGDFSQINDYCNNIADRIQGVINSYEISGSENQQENKEIKYPNGKTFDEFYEIENAIGTPKNILKNKSFAATALTTSRHDILTEIFNYAKTNNISDIKNIKETDLKAPATYKKYLNERNALSKIKYLDIVTASPLNVSEVLAEKLKGKQGNEAVKIANDFVAEEIEKINTGTPKRVGYAIEINKQANDLAIPTQETIDIYADGFKADGIVKIKDQLRREANIRADVEFADSIRSNIIMLVAKKAVIMNEKFDEQTARDEINQIVNSN